MMKRFLTLILALCLALSCFTTTFAAGSALLGKTTLTLRFNGAAPTKVGDFFQVDILISNWDTNYLYACSYPLKWNKDVIVPADRILKTPLSESSTSAFNIARFFTQYDMYKFDTDTGESTGYYMSLGTTLDVGGDTAYYGKIVSSSLTTEKPEITTQGVPISGDEVRTVTLSFLVVGEGSMGLDFDVDADTVNDTSINKTLQILLSPKGQAELTLDNQTAGTTIAAKEPTVTLDGAAATLENGALTLPTQNTQGQEVLAWCAGTDTYRPGSSLTPTADLALESVAVPFTLQDGAQARIRENSSGLRFATEVWNVARLAEIGITPDQFGTLIVPTDMLGAAELTKQTADVLDIPTVGWYTQETASDSATFANAIVNLKLGNYIRPFTARSYVTMTYTDQSQQTFYTDNTVSRSIYRVVASAVTDENGIDYSKNTTAKSFFNLVLNRVGVRVTESNTGVFALADVYDYNAVSFFDLTPQGLVTVKQRAQENGIKLEDYTVVINNGTQMSSITTDGVTIDLAPYTGEYSVEAEAPVTEEIEPLEIVEELVGEGELVEQL